MKQSLNDTAYRILKRKRKEMSFSQLWNEVVEEGNLTEVEARKRISSFYNTLMLDSRFLPLENNMWNLRERCTSESIKISQGLLEPYEEDELWHELEDLKHTY